MTWQREKPTEHGDWLWVQMWECGDCVASSGIAYINEIGDFSWEGSKPLEGVEITAWIKIKMPPKEWFD